MNAIMAWTGVKLRYRKIRRRLAQDLVGLAEFAHLAFQGLDAVPLLAARSGSQTLIPLRLAHPAAQRFPCAANLRRYRADRCPLRGVIRPMLQHHPHRPQTDLS